MSTEFNPDYAVPPGTTLRETIECMEIPTENLAQRLGRSEEEIELLLTGSRQLTPDIAQGLEKITRVPSDLWLTLEANYRNRLARLGRKKRDKCIS